MQRPNRITSRHPSPAPPKRAQKWLELQATDQIRYGRILQLLPWAGMACSPNHSVISESQSGTLDENVGMKLPPLGFTLMAAFVKLYRYGLLQRWHITGIREKISCYWYLVKSDSKNQQCLPKGTGMQLKCFYFALCMYVKAYCINYVVDCFKRDCQSELKKEYSMSFTAIISPDSPSHFRPPMQCGVVDRAAD